MVTFEYRIEQLKFETGSSSEEQLLTAINHFGSEGWRTTRMFADISLKNLASLKGGIKLMLERESQG